LRMEDAADFQDALRELTRGTVQAEVVETQLDTIFPVTDADLA